MDFFSEYQQLRDVPATFKRPDQTYDQIVRSFAASLSISDEAVLGTMNETNYQIATVGWIDVWGDLAGISRRVGEGDPTFHARLPNMLLAARDSVVAIQTWLAVIENVSGFVVEYIGSCGYTVYLPASLTQDRIKQIINNLAYVRPAGVPFNVIASTGGTYLNTVNYAQNGYSFASSQFVFQQFIVAEDDTVDPPVQQLLRITGNDPAGITGHVTGSYLASTESTAGLGPNAGTDNQQSLLPSLLLTDPTLNPGA